MASLYSWSLHTYALCGLCSQMTSVEDVCKTSAHWFHRLSTSRSISSVDKMFIDFVIIFLSSDASVDMERNGKAVHISMLRNPSHLEAVNPVSMGKARSKQLSLKDYSYKKSGASPSTKVLNIQLHGDAAYPGQGVNQECLMMAY
uniref:Uncharacterized protein n=1 Tax=Megaselia scalaris TaxID=36166 RepID=T1GD40_MEGSC